jgi:DNA invertase Pin-like site-specific DNA recombinase
LNYAEEIRLKLNKNSSDPINAVIYARVSTDNEGQKESCANQVDLAKNYIANHPNINLVNIYVDDGISGKNDFTRPQYNKMLQHLSNGAFDLIITKALSRLNRDEYNSMHLTNLLLAHTATILTLEDNQIHDFEDLNSGLLHSISFAMDAQYVKRQSINGKKTHELRCERKVLSAKDCSFGYDWHSDDKSITINQDQAEIVRRIFEDYVYRNGTPATIHKSLKAENINICSRSVSNIIQDERYIGNFHINKRTSKLGTGQTKSKRISLPKEEWVLVERPDLQIVDTEIFEMAQRIHQTRITVYEKPDKKTTRARFQGMHKYAGKIFCPVCGKPYHFGYADRKKTSPIYRIKSHSECSNPICRIGQSDLEELTRQALKQTIDQQDEVCTSLELVLTECVDASQNNGDEINRLKKQKNSKEKQIDSLIDALSEGGLNDAAKKRIAEKINHITEEIESLSQAIEDKQNNKLDVSYVTDKIAEIKSAIANLRNFTSIDRDRVLNYIERIELPANGDIDMILKSGQVMKIKAQNNSDFSNGKSVVKGGSQDVLYSGPVAYQWLRRP